MSSGLYWVWERAAVEPSDHDFSRLIALNAPERQPLRTAEDARLWAQRKVDVLDLESSERVAMDFPDLSTQCPDLAVNLFGSRDEELVRMYASQGQKDVFPWFISFESLIRDTDFVNRMRGMVAYSSGILRAPN